MITWWSCTVLPCFWTVPLDDLDSWFSNCQGTQETPELVHERMLRGKSNMNQHLCFKDTSLYLEVLWKHYPQSAGVQWTMDPNCTECKSRPNHTSNMALLLCSQYLAGFVVAVQASMARPAISTNSILYRYTRRSSMQGSMSCPELTLPKRHRV
jgi:hypothetical protein